MSYVGPERRVSPRINAQFIVSYRVIKDDENVETAQTKNFSVGGMLLTTNKLFEPGVKLALEIRLPFDPNTIMLLARVIGSKMIIKDLIYDTRLQFISVDDKHRGIVSKTVNYYLKKE